MALFTDAGIYFLAKWLHFFFGVMWIGHLYYFNFTQGTAIAQVEPANIRPNVLSKFLPVALYWFRWGAMWTFVSGLVMISLRRESFHTMDNWAQVILVGASFGTLMWANVWFVIWPNQKVVIQSNTQLASGGAALPEAAACGARALVASRVNTLFSIPMLFFMGAARNLPIQMMPESPYMIFWVVFLALLVGLELFALKAKDPGPLKTVKSVIAAGFILTAIVYGLIEIIL